MPSELLINNRWVDADGDTFASFSSADMAPGGEPVWTGAAATSDNVSNAFSAARNAFPSWCETSLETRLEIARQFAEAVKNDAEAFAELISREMGKPLWEAKTEVGAVAGKIELAISAIQERRWTTTTESADSKTVTRYKPHGVLGVLGPFNLPAHLPNGHIVPAVLAGNCVVFKPSELTPAIGAKLVSYWLQTELPPGVINLVQGSRETGAALAANDELDGLLFTGSSRAGIALHKSLADRPDKIVALEMGGNNPLVVHQVKDLRAAAYHTILSAFITSGQRCTCARRLFVTNDAEADSFLQTLAEMTGEIRAGIYTDDPEPFIGPVINHQAGERLLKAQTDLIARGGKPLVKAAALNGNAALLSPGLIDVTAISDLEDEELFGPILQVTRVESFEAAIQAANQTRYGLSAGLISDDRKLYEQFIRKIRAGVVNWNRQTTGASGKLPFGGCGLSGNHRPSGYFAADYCSFPVASIESANVSLPEKQLPGLQF